ncbi:MAG: zinc-dependent dehydrogenase [Anaerolineales bacterium]
MKAAVYHGPNDIQVEDVPTPQPGVREMVIRVHSASICGTDLRIYHGKHRMYSADTVRIPGHEVVGEIAEMGKQVDGFQLGQKVFVAPNMGCGHCEQCVTGNNNLCKNYTALGVTIDGGFAEYMLIPEQAILQGNIIPIDEGVDSAVAALIEPFACVLRGQNAVHIKPGEIVLIIGAGPIGVMHTKLAKVRGAGMVIVSEPIDFRAQQAASAGADYTINPLEKDLKEDLQKLTDGHGADVIIVAAPVNAAQESTLDLAAIRGRINFFGGLPKDKPTINFNSNLVHYKELMVTGTTACSTANCWQASQLINYGLVDLSDLISQRFPLEQTIQAFEAAEDRQSLKIVIEP